MSTEHDHMTWKKQPIKISWISIRRTFSKKITWNKTGQQDVVLFVFNYLWFIHHYPHHFLFLLSCFLFLLPDLFVLFIFTNKSFRQNPCSLVWFSNWFSCSFTLYCNKIVWLFKGFALAKALSLCGAQRSCPMAIPPIVLLNHDWAFYIQWRVTLMLPHTS